MTEEITVARLYALIAEKKQPNAIEVKGVTYIWNKDIRHYEGKVDHSPVAFTASSFAANTRVKCFYPALDSIEKEYLSAVIKPFRDRVISIEKKELSLYMKEFLVIDISTKHMDVEDSVVFPCFEAGTMYKGMELGKCYTLKELGL